MSRHTDRQVAIALPNRRACGARQMMGLVGSSEPPKSGAGSNRDGPGGVAGSAGDVEPKIVEPSMTEADWALA
jgi:hypothetical protein